MVGGGIGAAIDGRDIGEGIAQGAKYGAIAGAASAGINIGLYGAAYRPERKYGNFGRNGPVYRRGTLFRNQGAITLGRNLVLNASKGNSFIEAHETYHYQQQIEMGFGNFYGRTSYEYLVNPGFNNVYVTPGTLEWDADNYAKPYGR